MPTYRKKSESSIVTSMGEYLQILENLGQIKFWSRQQAGNLLFNRGSRTYKMRLARKGASDLYLIPKSGYSMAWIEAKTIAGEQSEAQIDFQRIVEGSGHAYILAHNCDELEKALRLKGII